MNGLHRFGSLCIFAAAVCDFLDGRVARMLGVTSEIGAQLDSLADVVSFGVAPAILAHSIKNWSLTMIIAFVTFPYVRIVESRSSTREKHVRLDTRLDWLVRGV